MDPGIGSARGAALYVGALMGSGVLLVLALAVEAAGPAPVIAWAALLPLSTPLAATFAALGMRHPEPGGVAVYVRRGLGERAAGVTGLLFVTAVLIGAPAVALVGGFYVADLAGAGRLVAIAVAVGLVPAATAGVAAALRPSRPRP